MSDEPLLVVRASWIEAHPQLFMLLVLIGTVLVIVLVAARS